MIRDITIGQYYPAKSVVHRLDPRVKTDMYTAVSDLAVSYSAVFRDILWQRYF